jgi:putative phage-type endonuclease
MNDRHGFIGGSDVAAILGLSPYGSAWSVWLEKVGGGTAERSDEMDERLEIGKDAEQFLATVFNRHHADAGEFAMVGQIELENEQYPWLRGHADGKVVNALAARNSANPTPHAGWEAKTDRSFAVWDEVPAYYQCQAQTYMLLSGLDHWWFTVGFGGWKVKHYVVAADAEDQALIIKATEAFWNDHVLTGIPPEPDAHPATTAAIKHHYNTADPDDIVWADEATSGFVHLLRAAKEDLAHAQAKVTEFENRIKIAMGDCVELRYGDRTLATWKAQTAARVDTRRLKAERPDIADEYTNTTTTRVFRVKEEK